MYSVILHANLYMQGQRQLALVGNGHLYEGSDSLYNVYTHLKLNVAIHDTQLVIIKSLNVGTGQQ